LKKKRLRKKTDYSSDEYEKEQLKSHKKKQRNSFSIKTVCFPETPTTPTTPSTTPVGTGFRATMDDSIFTTKKSIKNLIKSEFLLPPKPAYVQKSSSLENPKNLKSQDTLLGNPVKRKNIKSQEILLGNPNKPSTESCIKTKGILVEENHRHKNQSDLFMGKRPKLDFTGTRTDQFQRPKSAHYVKKH